MNKLYNAYDFFIMQGYFDVSIDNNLIVCSGGILKPKGDPDFRPELEIFEWHVVDKLNGATKEIVIVSFEKHKEGIIFKYRKQQFEVVSISDGTITIGNETGDYFIHRVTPAFVTVK